MWPDRFFVNQLLRSLAVKPSDLVHDVDVVVYFQDDTVMHSGIVAAKLIRSTWGTAHAWDHGTFEVPTGFGSTVRYFDVLPAASVIHRGAIPSLLNVPHSI